MRIRTLLRDQCKNNKNNAPFREAERGIVVKCCSLCDNIPMPPEEKSQNQQVTQTLRTYQSDVEDALKDGGGSLAKIAVAESIKRANEPFTSIGDTEESERENRTKIIWGISIGLVVLGIIIFSLFYFLRGLGQSPAPIISQTSPIIITDVEKNVDISGLDREALIAKLFSEQQNNLVKLSSVAGLRLIDGVGEVVSQITAKKFFQKLSARPPDELVRSLQDNFLFGLYSLNTNKPFLIFKTDYYQSAFAGMIAWEKDLVADLGPIFVDSQVLSQFGKFEDITIKNRDTRALRDSTGRIIFLYSFPDKSTIVITTNADTLDAIGARLLAGKLVH